MGKVPEGQRRDYVVRIIRHQVTLLQSLSRHNQLGWQGSINRFDTVRRTRPNTGGDDRGLTTTSHFTTADISNETADYTSTELVGVQLVEWSVEPLFHNETVCNLILYLMKSISYKSCYCFMEPNEITRSTLT